jgi:hypothetical protein
VTRLFTLEISRRFNQTIRQFVVLHSYAFS